VTIVRNATAQILIFKLSQSNIMGKGKANKTAVSAKEVQTTDGNQPTDANKQTRNQKKNHRRQQKKLNHGNLSSESGHEFASESGIVLSALNTANAALNTASTGFTIGNNSSAGIPTSPSVLSDDPNNISSSIVNFNCNDIAAALTDITLKNHCEGFIKKCENYEKNVRIQKRKFMGPLVDELLLQIGESALYTLEEAERFGGQDAVEGEMVKYIHMSPLLKSVMDYMRQLYTAADHSRVTRDMHDFTVVFFDTVELIITDTTLPSTATYQFERVLKDDIRANEYNLCWCFPIEEESFPIQSSSLSSTSAQNLV
jgi:hypothetical protein